MNNIPANVGATSTANGRPLRLRERPWRRRRSEASRGMSGPRPGSGGAFAFWSSSGNIGGEKVLREKVRCLQQKVRQVVPLPSILSLTAKGKSKEPDRGRGREGETETRTNSKKNKLRATTTLSRQSERGEHVGMSQLPAPPTSGSLGMSQLPARGLLKLWECLSLRPLKFYEDSLRGAHMLSEKVYSI